MGHLARKQALPYIKVLFKSFHSHGDILRFYLQTKVRTTLYSIQKIEPMKELFKSFHSNDHTYHRKLFWPLDNFFFYSTDIAFPESSGGKICVLFRKSWQSITNTSSITAKTIHLLSREVLMTCTWFSWHNAAADHVDGIRDGIVITATSRG